LFGRKCERGNQDEREGQQKAGSKKSIVHIPAQATFTVILKHSRCSPHRQEADAEGCQTVGMGPESMGIRWGPNCGAPNTRPSFMSTPGAMP
jgi:hypothetical protein